MSKQIASHAKKRGRNDSHLHNQLIHNEHIRNNSPALALVNFGAFDWLDRSTFIDSWE